MASANLVGLKRRLTTVTSTRKITKAMGLVATSKYQQCRNLLAGTASYQTAITELLEIIIPREWTEDMAEPALMTSGRGEDLIVLFNANKGMAGAYNAVLVQSLAKILQEKPARVLALGHRGLADIRADLGDKLEIMEAPDLPEAEFAQTLYRELTRRFLQGEAATIRLLYSKYLSALKTEISLEAFLPFQGQNSGAKESDYDFEPDALSLLSPTLELYLGQSLQLALTHGKTSEHAARMKSMEGASRNADELLRALHKQLNRLRQTTITQEITEIVGGAQALK